LSVYISFLKPGIGDATTACDRLRKIIDSGSTMSSDTTKQKRKSTSGRVLLNTNRFTSAVGKNSTSSQEQDIAETVNEQIEEIKRPDADNNGDSDAEETSSDDSDSDDERSDPVVSGDDGKRRETDQDSESDHDDQEEGYHEEGESITMLHY
jgi:hypothetical protein